MWLDILNDMKRRSGKTTEQISNASGIPKGTLNKLFAGQTKDPQYSTIYAVVHSLGYTVDDLAPTEKTPTENTVEADALKIYDALISSGLLKKGADLTPKQVDGLTGIAMIIYDPHKSFTIKSYINTI